MSRSKCTWIVVALLAGSLAACERGNDVPRPKTAQAPATSQSPADPPVRPSPATAAASTANDADRTFVREAVAAGIAEVSITAHAMDKSASPRVKETATRLNRDHLKANEELKRIAATKGLALPATPDDEKRADVDQLRTLSGSELDRAVVPKLVESHRKSIERFEHETSAGADPDVKGFAEKTLPTLREHLKMVEALQANDPGAARSTNEPRAAAK